jgi:hypothetical protein
LRNGKKAPDCFEPNELIIQIPTEISVPADVSSQPGL